MYGILFKRGSLKIPPNLPIMGIWRILKTRFDFIKWKSMSENLQIQNFSSFEPLSEELWRWHWECVTMVPSQNIDFLFSSISPAYFYESFTVISQKIENFLLYRTVFKDIFSMLSQTRRYSIYLVRDHSKIGSSDSILIKRVSRKVGAIFSTPDSERALKTASNGIYDTFITHWFDT